MGTMSSFLVRTATRPGHTTRLSQNRNHEIPQNPRHESRFTARDSKLQIMQFTKSILMLCGFLSVTLAMEGSRMERTKGNCYACHQTEVNCIRSKLCDGSYRKVIGDSLVGLFQALNAFDSNNTRWSRDGEEKVADRFLREAAPMLAALDTIHGKDAVDEEEWDLKQSKASFQVDSKGRPSGLPTATRLVEDSHIKALTKLQSSIQKEC